MTWVHSGSPYKNTVTGKQSIPVNFSDSPSLDAFGNLRVAEPVTLFDIQFQYDLQPLFWESQITGGGTVVHDPNNSGVNLTVGTSSGDKVIRQSRIYPRYQPGKSRKIPATGILGNGKSNVTQRIGCFDDDNGLFFHCIDGVLGVTLRSKTSGVVDDTTKRIAQADWNLDTMDGSADENNPSGFNLNPVNAQLFIIDLEWLSVGRVRMGFQIDGIIQYVHQFLNSNRIGGAYMTTANLPLRYEIENTGVAASATALKQLCSSIQTEGGVPLEIGLPFSDSNGITQIAVTTRRPILSIRPKLTFNSIVNRGLIIPENFLVFATTNAAFIEIVYNGDLTNDTFARNQSNSIVDIDIAADAISGGEIIFADFVPITGSGQPASRQDASGSNILSKLPLTLDIAGTNPIPLSIVVTSLSGTSNVSGVWNWREVR